MILLKLLMTLVILLGMFFVSSAQPMFMVGTLIVIVLCYSYIMYMFMAGYWFSYALVMVMLSGVLVIFTYMVSLTPNENFESYNLFYMMGVVLLTLGISYIWLYDYKYGMFSLSLWSSFFGMFNMFMVSFLLSIMLVVVWMSYMGYGALRTV